MASKKITVGAVEPVSLYSPTLEILAIARMDTGAERSSIDVAIAKKLEAKVIKTIAVKSANGTTKRFVVRVPIKLKKKFVTVEFTVAQRSKMSCPVLIGRDVLQQGFVVDVSKSER